MTITTISVVYSDKTVDEFDTSIRFKEYSEIPVKLEEFVKNLENEGIDKVTGFTIYI